VAIRPSASNFLLCGFAALRRRSGQALREIQSGRRGAPELGGLGAEAGPKIFLRREKIGLLSDFKSNKFAGKRLSLLADSDIL
jgi:hypothetical protein